MQQQTQSVGARTQFTLVDSRKRKAACFQVTDETGAIVASIYRDDIARLIAAAPTMYFFVASKADSGDAEAMQIIKDIQNASR